MFFLSLGREGRKKGRGHGSAGAIISDSHYMVKRKKKKEKKDGILRGRLFFGRSKIGSSSATPPSHDC